MNVQKLTDQEITLLEIFLNNYKHSRAMMRQIPRSDKTRKAIRTSTRRFEDWITSLNNEQVRFLTQFGLVNALEEVNRYNQKENPFHNTPIYHYKRVVV